MTEKSYIEKLTKKFDGVKLEIARGSGVPHLFIKGKIPKDFPVLIELSHVEKLTLEDVEANDLNFLEGMNKINEIYIRDSSIRHPESMNDLKNLKEMYIRPLSCFENATKKTGANIIYDFDWLHAKNLKKFSASMDQNARDITHLDNLPSLESLSLEPLLHNPPAIMQLKNVGNLKTLKSLWINRMYLKNIEGLDFLTSLKELTLTSCFIQKLQNINHLADLEVLDLYKNSIKKIENLEGLSNLKKLNLSENGGISKIENLETLVNLEILILEHCTIEKIEGLSNLSKLRTLNLSRNRISKIEGLGNLKGLKNLSLGTNYIGLKDLMSDIEDISDLERLDCLNIEINPKNYPYLSNRPSIHSQLEELKQKLPTVKIKGGFDNAYYTFETHFNIDAWL